MLSLTENQQCENKVMLTIDMYSKVGVVAKSMMEVPTSNDQIARINEGTYRDALSPN